MSAVFYYGFFDYWCTAQAELWCALAVMAALCIVRRARTALRDTRQRDANISEIAYHWGFNDLSHFNKAFRARFNTTPRAWRSGSDE